MIRLLAVAAASMIAPAMTAPIPVTPATFLATLNAAKTGSVLALGDGDYGDVYLRATPSVPVTLDACASNGAATFRSLRIDGRTGYVLRCLSFTGTALNMQGVRDVTIDRLLSVNPLRAAIQMGNSAGVTMTDIEVSGAGSDAIDIAGSQHITIDRLAVYGGKPTPGAHPDGVQWYSGLTQARSSYITIRNVSIVGPSQGVAAFGNKQPCDHIVYENITVMTTMSRGISLPTTCTDTPPMKNARVERMRGATRIVQIDGPGAGDAKLGNSGNSSRP